MEAHRNASERGSSSSGSEAEFPFVPGARSVVMSCHDTEMRVQFVGSETCPFPELKRCYYEAFGKIERMLDFEPTAREYVEVEEPAFQLLDRDYQIFFEGFTSADIYEGAIVKVEPVLLKSESEIAAYKAQLEEEAKAALQEKAVQARESLKSAVLSAAKRKEQLNVQTNELPIYDLPGDGDNSPGDLSAVPAEGSTLFDPTLPGTIPEESAHSVQSGTGSRVPLLTPGLAVMGGNMLRRTNSTSGDDSFDFRDGNRTGSADGLSKLGAPKVRVPWTEGGECSTERSSFSQRVAAYRAVVWTTLDNPMSSNLAAAITLLVIFFILVSTLTLVVQTFPIFHHPQQPFGPWFIAETIPIIFFTVEVLARLWSCPTWRTFWCDPFNVIDLMSVMPFYVELFFLARGAAVPVLLRLLRLIRVFRLIKMSKGSVRVFAETMRSSMRLLYMLLFMVFVSLLVFGSLIYFVERGRWNPLLGVFEQPVYYMCPVLVALPDEPSRPTIYAEGSTEKDCQPIWQRFANTGATTMCRYSWEVNDECVRIYSEGEFLSIWHSTWFVMQTISTVGFGDAVPMTDVGTCISAVVIMFGLVVVSLPITVIGANFSRTYRGHQRQLWANHELHQYHDLPWLKRVAFNLIYS